MRTHLLARVFGTTAVLMAARGAMAAAEYQFILVDAFYTTYGLRECYLYDINNDGVACGTATIKIGSNVSYTGFYWSRANEKTPAPISWPRGISVPGLMAGVSGVYDIPSGQFTEVPLLPQTYRPLALLGVNDQGVAVGWVQICNCSNSQGMLQIPYVWDAAQGARTLPVSGANGAARINNNGVIVGWIGGNAMANGYVYDLRTGEQVIVSTLFGGQNIQTTAVDVNEDDVIVGWRKNESGQAIGYTWSRADGVRLLPLPPPEYQPYVRPAGINRALQVVGSIYAPNGSSLAFVYDAANGVRDLNRLCDTQGMTLMTATAINDRGWIVGYGYGGGGMYKSFVLVPLRTGDLNCDGAVNFGDINPFVLALGDPEEYRRQFPDCDINQADCNGDGRVDFGDINPFVALLSR